MKAMQMREGAGGSRQLDIKMRFCEMLFSAFHRRAIPHPASRSAHFRHIRSSSASDVTIGNQSTIDICLAFWCCGCGWVVVKKKCFFKE